MDKPQSCLGGWVDKAMDLYDLMEALRAGSIPDTGDFFYMIMMVERRR